MPKQKTKKKPSVKKTTKKTAVKKKINRKTVPKKIKKVLKPKAKKIKQVKKKNTAKSKAKISVKKKSPRKKKTKKMPGLRIPVKTLAEETAGSILASQIDQQPDEVTEQANEFEDFDFGELKEENIEEILEKEPEGKFGYTDEDSQRQADLTPRQKTVLMYIAVACIMVVISSFWFLAVKNSLGQFIVGNSSDQEQAKATQDAKDALSDVQNDFNQIKEIINQNSDSLDDFQDQTKNQIIENQIKNDAVKKIQEQLETEKNINNDIVNDNLNTNQ